VLADLYASRRGCKSPASRSFKFLRTPLPSTFTASLAQQRQTICVSNAGRTVHCFEGIPRSKRMKQILALYYSQTGQLGEIIESIVAPLRASPECSW
jgi:hypothetical protein